MREDDSNISLDESDTRKPQSVGEHLWLVLLMINLFGLALLGRGWANLGIPPLFVGELVLVLGAFVVFLSGYWNLFFQSRLIWPLWVLMVWGAYRTLPYLGQYGFHALRDAVLLGYALFAILTFVYICSKPERLSILVRGYARFATWFLVLIPLIWIPSQFLQDKLPANPITFLFLNAKGGDTGVHLAGVMAFWAVGIGAAPSFRLLILFCFTFAWVAAVNRGGLLSFLLAISFVCCFRPYNVVVWRFALLGATTLLLLLVIDFRIQIPGRERKIDATQFIENVTSVASKTKSGDLDGTKEWRLMWWSEIVDYTIFGRYYWVGKGFGVNLADDDGFQVSSDGSLRSPHNGHLNVLARSGVPGFVMWCTALGAWFIAMVTELRRSLIHRERNWTNLLLFLTAYWIAFSVNATFDVFLEGPMGGIWYWTLYGIGMAAIWIHRHCPEALDLSAQPNLFPNCR
ncbi:O-Antigen ligase [Pirellula sp. SH-Sr6A]|uniref:O-antigen ligase family protein n=1 Tax=Pirellula sp. SH-Sr6A TaxID=1632865 RepID=UPI00078D7465|nr:O-antigen ligase family protein [Pirellula sp. SH-Sr6A]AMV32007.1 O-Antigen ligase [Pirellula sp. SH-Sr6A]